MTYSTAHLTWCTDQNWQNNQVGQLNTDDKQTIFILMDSTLKVVTHNSVGIHIAVVM